MVGLHLWALSLLQWVAAQISLPSLSLTLATSLFQASAGDLGKVYTELGAPQPGSPWSSLASLSLAVVALNAVLSSPERLQGFHHGFKFSAQHIGGSAVKLKAIKTGNYNCVVMDINSTFCDNHLQYIQTLNPYVIHLELIQCFTSIISQFKKNFFLIKYLFCLEIKIDFLN